jgi:formylglycine-generating enzyme required for sulfatase activity
LAANIFINYRREDSAGYAGRIHDRLASEFGPDRLFLDVDSIPLATDFTKVLSDEVGKCNVLLAIVGPRWLDVTDEHGNRRLDNPEDFVRIEIAAALKRNIPVIPILLDGTRVPTANRLPEGLKELAVRNGLDVRHASFHSDMERLIRRLRQAIDPAPAPRPPSTPADVLGGQGRIKVDARVLQGAPSGWLEPGAGKSEWFKDHPAAPEMVVVPAGRFVMGASQNELQDGSFSGRYRPQHEVTFVQPFAVGRHAITRGEFTAFVNNTGYRTQAGAYLVPREHTFDPDASWRNPGFAQDDSHPVVCLRWEDAKAYADWLTHHSGKTYRLLSEAEREYVARAGTTTPFWSGSSITPAHANYNENINNGLEDVFRNRTLPVGSSAANPWGLYDINGNVREWCEDVWHDTYHGAPTDGSAWLLGGATDVRVIRGGCWAAGTIPCQSAYRDWRLTSHAMNNLGFRLARALDD